MLGQDRKPGLTPQVGFAIAMALFVLALLYSALTHSADAPSALRTYVQNKLSELASQRSTPDPEQAVAEAEGETPGTTSVAGTAVPTARAATRTPALTPEATLKPQDAIRRDHYWLQRPIAAPGDSTVARFYPYGSRMDGTYPVHYGVEMVNAEGTPVLAPAPAVVVAAGSDAQQVYGARPGFYGQLIVLQLEQRFQGVPVYVVFGHLSEIQVSIGQMVTTGQQVGLVGATGDAEAPHLHSEVRIGKDDYGATVNPELWYVPQPGRGTLAGALLDANGDLADTESKIVLTSSRGSTYELFTYPLSYVNPDPEWAENFCMGDLDAGSYTAEVFYRGILYRSEFTITAGETTWLSIPTD